MGGASAPRHGKHVSSFQYGYDNVLFTVPVVEQNVRSPDLGIGEPDVGHPRVVAGVPL